MKNYLIKSINITHSILFLLVLCLLSTISFAQQVMVIKFKDGHEQSIPLTDIVKIDFRQKTGPVVNETPPVSNNFKDLLLSGRSFTGEAKQGNKTWPFSIKFTKYDPQSGNIEGEITWKSLNSIHKIEGVLNGNDLEFTETAYIKKGGAYLNCIYHLKRNASLVNGTWSENGQSEGRTAWFSL